MKRSNIHLLLSEPFYLKQEEYWRDQLAGELSATGIMPDLHRNKEVEEAKFSFSLDPETQVNLNRISKQKEMPLYLILLTGLTSLTHLYTGSLDLTILAPVYEPKRTKATYNDLVAVRTQITPDQGFKELLLKVRETTLAAYEHQDFPFDQVVQSLGISQAEEQLFELGCSLENIHASLGIEEMNCNILFSFSQEEGSLQGQIRYNSQLFTPEMIQRVSNHYQQLLGQVMADIEMPIEKIELMSAEERQQILVDFNHTQADYPTDQLIHQLFEAQVERTPEKVAVRFEETYLTYRELNQRANQLATTLRERGVQPDQLVGIMVERSLEMMVAIMAILKAGAGYLPISPDYPLERIHYVLEDSGTEILLTHRCFADQVNFSGQIMDLKQEEIYQGEGENLVQTATPLSLAYVIYTSGSTGKPKGVMIQHRSVINRILWMQEQYPIGLDDTILQKTPFTFDVSVWELFWWSFVGAEQSLLIPGGEREPAQMIQTIQKHQVTTMHFVPSMLSIFLQHLEGGAEVGRLSSLRQVFASGEALTLQQVHQFNRLLYQEQGINLINLYGPTEATVDVSYFDCSPGKDLDRVPIGKPVANTQLYVVDQRNRLCPIGVPGELCIAGDQLARGYLGKEELTAEKFVANPFQLGTRMYRTGDLTRWLPDGNIEFLGRIDFQVKIRGFRIELGEIESQILSHPGIEEAVVLVKGDPGDQDLVAYWVGAADLTTTQLQGYLGRSLPEYMIPPYCIRLDQMPLNHNGKVNRKALPEPRVGLTTSTAYLPPTNELEEKLVKIWEQSLGVEGIGIQHNFFELGGQSLRAAEIISRVHQELLLALALSDVFEHPTVQQMAVHLARGPESDYQAIQPVGEQEYYPVSAAQRRLYILNQLEGSGVTYNIPGALTIQGRLDQHRLEQAFQELVARHESLRTSFLMVGEEVVQQVQSDVELAITYLEASEEELDQIAADWVRPFDLEQAPLIRVGLVQLTPERHLLLLDLHHIISDGVSMAILIREFASLYQGLELPELTIQYKDYAVWQHEQLQSAQMAKHEAYWLQAFAGENPVLNLPTDYPRPAVQSFQGDTITFEVEERLSAGLKQLAQQQGATLYMVLLAAYQVLLSKYSGQEEIIVGSPISGRFHPDLEEIMGMFVNTLALKNQPKGLKSFAHFLQEVKLNALSAYEHQDYQFEDLVEKLEVPRDLSRNPLFDTMFMLQNTDSGELEMEGLTLTPYNSEHQIAKFDLTLGAEERAGQIYCSLEYSTKLFKEITMRRLAEHYLHILQAIVQNPEVQLKDIQIQSPAERERLLVDYNATDQPYPENQTIYQLFEEQVAKSPEEVALVCGQEELTYRQLNGQANQLARHLQQRGVENNTIVGILAEPSFQLIVGILGTLKAGAAYLPIDPTYPQERIQYMLEDSGAQYLLTQSEELKQSHFSGTQIDLGEEALYTGEASNLPGLEVAGGLGNSLAYLIYTSGSTGKPKGVKVHHQGLVNYIWWAAEKYLQGDQLDFPLYTSISFDLTVTSIYTPLITGNRLFIYQAEGQELLIEKVIREDQVGILKATPAHLRIIKEMEISHSQIRRFIVGGEQLEQGLAREIAEKFTAEIYNEYGPTEATVGCMIHKFDPGTDEGVAVPIGVPAANMQIYLVDRYLQPVAENVPGEMYIGGVGVAQGYLGRPELTRERFVANPFRPGAKMYQTGDLARILPNGKMEFLGRADQQVKIRGYRIEPGEIENQLLTHPAVSDVVVLARKDPHGEQSLCAYLVGTEELTITQLREHVGEKLPEYMIPAYFVQIEAIPLTANGKVNHQLLPAPEGNLETGVEYVAPRNYIEEKLVEIWQELLIVQQVGIEDHFFKLGGDSIKAMQVASRLNKCGLKLEMKDLFRYPKISDLSSQISTLVVEAEQGLVQGSVALTPDQIRFFRSAGENGFHFHETVLLASSEKLDLQLLRAGLEEVVQHHDALRLSYQLGEEGWVQSHRSPEEALFELEVVDLTEEVEPGARIEATIDQIQMDVVCDPLLRVCLFQTQSGDKLMITGHYLIIDPYSLQLLVQDLTTVYRQLQAGVRVELPAKTHSFQQWSRGLEYWIASDQLRRQQAYWQKYLDLQTESVGEEEQATSETGMYKTLNWDQDREQTDLLLNQVNLAYNTDTQEILLTTLGLTIQEWAKRDQFLVQLSGDARQEVLPKLDLTRTIGRLTCEYPLLIDAQGSADLAYFIKSIKEDIRRVPDHGLGYTPLRLQLTEGAGGLAQQQVAASQTDPSDQDGTEQLRSNSPEIGFTYLGEMAQEFTTPLFSLAEGVLPRILGSVSEPMALQVNCWLKEGQLNLTYQYNSQQYTDQTITQLMQSYGENLQRIIDHCLQRDETEITPTDLGDQNLSLEDLDQIADLFG